MQLIILQYKNYFNRKVKYESSIQAYINASDESLIIDEYDFNPADGVDTSCVIGGQYYDYQDSNYLLVCEGQDIVSRWYIMDANRTRNGQYKVSLHRDVIVDNWDLIKSSPMYIERATLPNNSPFIQNSEGLPVNKIKTSQTELKDETGIAWLVGYIDRAYEGGTVSFNATSVPDFTYATKSAFKSAIGVNEESVYKRLNTSVPRTFRFAAYHGDPATHRYIFTLNFTSNTWSVTDDGLDTAPSTSLILNYTPIRVLNLLNNNSTLKLNIVEYEESSVFDQSNWSNSKVSTIEGINGKVLETTSDSSFQGINATISGGDYDYYAAAGVVTLLQTWFESNEVGVGQPESCVYYRRAETTISYRLNTAAAGQYNITMPSTSGRLHLKDAPYDMVCVPWGNIEIRNSKIGNWTNFTLDTSETMSIMQAVAAQLGANLFDLQLLPYCPMTGFNIGNGYIDINSSDTNRYTVGRTTANLAKIVLLWSTRSSGQKTISYTINPSNKKIANECDMWRLTSPNGSGAFEFNASRNNGVSTFIVSYTYVPYSPYIQVSPNFGGLYGSNFKDTRGLVCQGDFSISYLSDPWVNYVNSNKNYAAIFDRQIQNMEDTQKYQRISGGIQAAMGALSTGATAGLVGGVGVGVGAGILSAAGGVADMYVADKMFQLSKDYSKDMHNMSLENIKAQPQSLAKSSAYTYNNTIFPVIEYYTCTSQEKTAVANKIRYEGMTVGVTGTINDYIGNSWSYGGITDLGFIRGMIIQLELGDDFHLASTIRQELEKGVYTK